MSLIHYANADGKNVTPVSEATGLPVTSATTGSVDDPAWDGNDNPESLFALLKAIHAQLVTIAENTAA
jgi:hypothetical protein